MRAKWMKNHFGIKLRPYTIIVGKWNSNKYTVIRELGSGMIGTVYLCKHKGRYLALKISRQRLSMTKEVNVLKSIKEAQDKFLGPSLFDVDDWERSGHEVYSFYVMEYINGNSLVYVLRRYDRKWLRIILLQLLDQLEHLHNYGWVFGDLKADNIIIEKKNFNARFIDVGGTTKLGRSIKEYTEFYDRGYWELGSRKAEPSYDLFALVMVFISVYYPRPFRKTKSPLLLLDKKINQVPALRPLAGPFKKALRGEYTHASHMKDDIIKQLIGQHEKQDRQVGSLLEACLISVVALLFFTASFLML